MHIPFKVKLSVARKFMKYLKRNGLMPGSRKQLKLLYLETFRPHLNDGMERRVCPGDLLYFLKILKFILPRSKDDSEKIVYANGLSALVSMMKKNLLNSRKQLSRDIRDVSISPRSDGEGIFDMGEVTVNECKEFELEVKNKSDRKYFFGCVILGSVTDFNVKNAKYEFIGESEQITRNDGLLNGRETISIPVSFLQENPGVFHVVIAFWFKSAKDFPFHIVKFIKVEVKDDVVNDLKPVSPFQKFKCVYHQPAGRVVWGEKLPLPQIKNPVGLKTYPVPKKIRNAMKNAKAEFILPTFWGTSKDGKNVEIHCKRLAVLLHVEELQMNLDIRKYDIGRTTMEPVGNGYLALNVPGLMESRPSLVRGDRVFVRTLSENDMPSDEEYEGFIHEIRLDDVYLKFDRTFHRDYLRGTLVTVRFAFFRTCLRLMHRALGNAPRFLQQMPCDGRCSRNSTSPRALCYYDQKVANNEEQKQAVNNIVAGSSRPYPYLVFGPPGTGKTVTIVEAINQVLHIFPESKVLACAPSNSAADLILERVAQHNVVPKSQMIRLNAFSRSKSDVNPKVLEFCKMTTKDIFYFPPKEDIMYNHRLVVTTLISAGRLVSMGVGNSHFTHLFIDEAGQGMEPECFVPIAGLFNPTGSDVGQLVLAGDPRQLGPVVRSPLAVLKFATTMECHVAERSKLLCIKKGTTITLNHTVKSVEGMLYGAAEGNEGYIPKECVSLDDSKCFATAKFDYVPEEAELLGLDKGDIIRLEERKQLVKGMIYGVKDGNRGYFSERHVAYVEHGLDVSFLERLMSSQFPCYNRQLGTEPGKDGDYNAKMVTKLLNNYRSHPSIIKVPNELFYDNELRACADELLRESLCKWKDLPNKCFPIIFEGVCGEDEREEKSPSFFNPQEAAVVLRYVKAFKEARGLPLKTEEIGIISPYYKQVQKIRQYLQKKCNIRDIKVGSVEEFQGQERKVIIISTVRSSKEFFYLDAVSKLGFLNNPKRFNVAVTRAKALLIVVGNPHVLCQDKNWRKFIGFCQENGAYKGCEFEMPEVDDEYFSAQLNLLGLDNDAAFNKPDAGESNTFDSQEWRPAED